MWLVSRTPWTSLTVPCDQEQPDDTIPTLQLASRPAQTQSESNDCHLHPKIRLHLSPQQCQSEGTSERGAERRLFSLIYITWEMRSSQSHLYTGNNSISSHTCRQKTISQKESSKGLTATYIQLHIRHDRQSTLSQVCRDQGGASWGWMGLTDVPGGQMQLWGASRAARIFGRRAANFWK